jgi:hypothetical protein
MEIPVNGHKLVLLRYKSRPDCGVLSKKGLFSWYFDLSAIGFAFASYRVIRRKVKGLDLM